MLALAILQSAVEKKNNNKHAPKSMAGVDPFSRNQFLNDSNYQSPTLV